MSGDLCDYCAQSATVYATWSSYAGTGWTVIDWWRSRRNRMRAAACRDHATLLGQDMLAGVRTDQGKAANA